MLARVFTLTLTRTFTLTLVCVLGIGSAAAADKGAGTGAVSAGAREPAGLERQLDAFIAKGMIDWKIPGLSIVVVNDKGVVYEKGFGVREVGKPGKVDQFTQFGMMSTTKAMTALALAMLVDEGKVKWDDPVVKHLPRLRLPNAYLTEHVTVRDVLRHTSGVRDADLLWVREDMNTEQVLARLDRVAPTTALRSDFIYNNVMYQVAGEVIGAASGMRWEKFITTRIMAPLGMTESFATMSAMRAGHKSNVSLPHAEIDAAIRPIDEAGVDIVPAAGAAWSNAHDAGKWLAFLLAEGKVGERRLVSEANFKALFSPQVAISDPEQWGYPTLALTRSRVTAYGLGWFLQDYRGQYVAMHTGSMPGRTAIAGILPDAKIGVYVFGNLDHAEFRHALMWKVFDMYTDAPVRDWNGEALKLYGDRKKARLARQANADAKRVLNTRHSHALEAYTGTYGHPTWGDVTVALEAGVLVLRVGPSPNNLGRLEHWHHNTFRAKMGNGMDGWDQFGFRAAADGSIDAITMFDESFVRVVPAKATTI
ncbi:MAG: serine hydrolase [Pseudomonadota bacterium]